MVDCSPVISDKERVRRLVSLPGVKPERVARLRDTTVAIVGVGGIGQAAAQHLVAQGVGRIILIDPDRVEAHNLSRQILLTPPMVGQFKVDAAAERLWELSPTVQIEQRRDQLDEANVDALLQEAAIVLDGVDLGQPREVLNRYAMRSGKPVFFAGATGYEAQVFGVHGGQPCLTCLFGSVADVEDDCAATGVLGPVVGMAGLVQAQEVLKWVLQVGQSLVGRLWQWDGFSGSTRIIAIPSRTDCPVCSPAHPQ